MECGRIRKKIDALRCIHIYSLSLILLSISLSLSPSLSLCSSTHTHARTHAHAQSYDMSLLPHTGAFSAFLFGSCIPPGGLGAIAEYWHPTFKKFSIFVDPPPPPFRSPFHYFFGNSPRYTFLIRSSCLDVVVIFLTTKKL